MECEKCTRINQENQESNQPKNMKESSTQTLEILVKSEKVEFENYQCSAGQIIFLSVFEIQAPMLMLKNFQMQMKT